MSIAGRTPFRQLGRAYAALNNISHAALNFQASQRNAIREGMAGVEGALMGVQAAISLNAQREPVASSRGDVALHECLGLNLLLDKSSLVDRCVIETGTWEPEQIAYVAGLTELFRKFEKPVFLDIGSYWGLYSFLAMKTIDSVITDTGRYILMKLDVEGHEAQVLRGMAQTVSNNKVVLQIEVFDEHADRVMAEVEALGLRTIHAIYPDRYLTNMTDAELGIEADGRA